ncbi:MAG: flippase-like domain-containing protein [Acidobacteria bacterium]|nr:flippase-like domain-containing protein [Acidobacteriota bacterium]
MPNQRLKLKFTLWLIVAIGLVYYFAHRLDWSEVKSSYRGLRLGFAVTAILPILGTYLARAVRWRAFLAPIAQPSIRNLFAATTVGFSSIFIFGRVGEVARPVVLSLRERIRPSATFATIMIERIYDLTAVVLLFAVDLALFEKLSGDDPTSHQLATIREAGIGLLLIIALGIVMLSIFRSRVDWVLGFLEMHLSWLPAKVQRVLLNLSQHLADGLYVLHDTRGLLVTIGHTAALWALVTLSFWLLVRAFGLHLPLIAVIFVMGFAQVGSLIPTPGGSAGAFHTTTMVGLMLLGIEQNKAASVAIAMHLVAFGSALLFGIYFFLRDGISFKELRAIAAEEMTPARMTLKL